MNASLLLGQGTLPMGLIPLGEFWATYGFRVMTLGTLLVGFFAGALGSILYVRKQSLASDVIGHSAIAGIVGGFVIVSIFGGDGQSILVLTVGATIAGILSVATMNLIAEKSKIGIEAAMAISLAIFYGGGMVALRLLSFSNFSGRSGIADYLFGNAATMRKIDVITIGILGIIALFTVLLFWKEITLYAFDPVGARVAGFSSSTLNVIITLTTTVGIVIGVKSVGAVLMVAFAIIPAAAMRQFTDNLRILFWGAGAVGGIAGGIGSYLAVSIGKVPTGPIIVLLLTLVLAVSLVFSPHRSLLAHRYRRRRHLREISAAANAQSDDNAAQARNIAASAPKFTDPLQPQDQLTQNKLAQNQATQGVEVK